MSETQQDSSQDLVDLTLSSTTPTSSFHRPPRPEVTSPNYQVFSSLPPCDEESSCASPFPALDDDDDDDESLCYSTSSKALSSPSLSPISLISQSEFSVCSNSNLCTQEIASLNPRKLEFESFDIKNHNNSDSGEDIIVGGQLIFINMNSGSSNDTLSLSPFPALDDDDDDKESLCYSTSSKALSSPSLSPVSSLISQSEFSVCSNSNFLCTQEIASLNPRKLEFDSGEDIIVGGEFINNHKSGLRGNNDCRGELSSCGDGSDNYNKGSTASENIGPPKPPKPRRSARIKQLKRKQDDERSPKCTRSGRRY
jgi:hypothetical protein